MKNTNKSDFGLKEIINRKIEPVDVENRPIEGGKKEGKKDAILSILSEMMVNIKK